MGRSGQTRDPDIDGRVHFAAPAMPPPAWRARKMAMMTSQARRMRRVAKWEILAVQAMLEMVAM